VKLGDLHTRLRQDMAFGLFDHAYLHRAHRETQSGRIAGRDAMRDATLAEVAAAGAQPVTVRADLGDMVSFDAGGARTHVWVRREDARIAQETVVATRAFGRPQSQHPPLGELRSGRGQLSAGDSAILPPGTPDAARPVADALHRIWNGRRFDGIAALYADPAPLATWLPGFLATLAGATLFFERAIAEGDRVALLWRLFADVDGHRLRLLGSSLLTLDGGRVAADDTVFDLTGFHAQRAAPLIGA
jgi:hypothetical protein